MQLSAIVPTHERPVALRRCLQSLQAQAISDRLEIVVVDDGSESDIAALVNSLAAPGPIDMRYERQPLSGLNSARNRGAAAAHGDLLAFLDDDTIVAPGWAQALWTAFEQHPCTAVGGKVELGLEGPAPEWLAARRYYLAEYDLGPAPRWIEGQDPVPVGANCAVRRSAFEGIGGFHPGLDRIGPSLVSNGDTEFFHRLRATDARLRYEPAASVIHCVPAERLTVDYFIRRHYAQGVSDELQLKMEEGGSTLRRRAILVRWLLRNVMPGAKTLLEEARRDRGIVMARFVSSYWAGRLRGAGLTLQPRETNEAHPAPTGTAPP